MDTPTSLAMTDTPCVRPSSRQPADCPIWKTVKIGTTDKESLIEMFVAKGYDGSSVVDMVSRFGLCSSEQELDLVTLSARELGFDEEYPALDDFYERAKSVGFEICPAEVALRLRLEYTDQPVDSSVAIATDVLRDEDGGRFGLYLFNWSSQGSGIYRKANPHYFWSSLDWRHVFVKPRGK